MASAEEFGRKLLAEVEEVGLDEIFRALRLQIEEQHPSYFNFPPLDRLLRTALESRQHTSKPQTTPPILELMSLAPGGGKTHLLYHLTARAVVPTYLGGKQACVVIIETDNNFCTNRLATQVELHIHKQLSQSLEADTAPDSEKEIKETILTCLKHVHIFRPQTLASTTATLESLPSYLFNSSRHFSFDRAVGFIALDSTSAFYWEDKAETEDAAFLASTSATLPKPAAPQSGYVALAASLKSACKTFDCPAIVTSWHLSPSSTMHYNQQHQHPPPHTRSLRSTFSAAFANLPTLRLMVRRMPVRKFPPGMSVTDALREGVMRQKAVEEGKFECFVNEWDLDERVVGRLRGGFEFRILAEGVLAKEDEEEE